MSYILKILVWQVYDSRESGSHDLRASVEEFINCYIW